MQLYDFSQFDWINYVMLVALAPVQALVCHRALTPRYSFRKTGWIVLLATMVIAAFNVAGSKAALQTIASTGTIASVLESVAYCTLWRCLTKDSLGKVLVFYFGWVLLMGFGYSAGNLTYGIFASVAGADNALDVVLRGNAREVFVLIFQSVMTIVATNLIAARARRLSADTDVRWSMFTLVLFVQMFANLLIAGFLTWQKFDIENILLLAIYMLLCIVSDVYVLRTFRSMVANAELTQRVALLNQQQTLENARYVAANEQMQNMRRLRHDYSNTLSTIGTLLSMGETDKLREILHSTSQMLDETRILRTGNQTVDAVLYSKQLSAEQKGISLRVALLWPETLTASDTELMRIFGNLLDNAIRYCATLPEGVERHIEVTNVLQGRMLALRFANPYLGDVPPAIAEPGVDAPMETHGHGLAIVREIAEAHGGALVASVADGMLTFTVLLSAAETRPPENA